MQKVLVCDAAYQPHHWVRWQDAIILKYKDLICNESGSLSFYHGGESRITGYRTKIEIGSIMFLRDILKYDSRGIPLTNQNLFARDNNKCIYCGRVYSDIKLSRDHIIPVSKGGRNVWQNVATCCKVCNHAKGDESLKKLGWEMLYKPYVPVHSERLIMQHRHASKEQKEFLKQYLPEHSRLL